MAVLRPSNVAMNVSSPATATFSRDISLKFTRLYCAAFSVATAKSFDVVVSFNVD